MPGWLENRRKAKEAARQRAIKADLEANDRIAYGFVPARNDGPAPESSPTPPVSRPEPAARPAPAGPGPAPQASSSTGDDGFPGPDFRPAGAGADAAPSRPEARPASRPAEPAPAPRSDLSPDQAVEELLGINGALAAAVVAGDSGEVLAESAGAGFDLGLAAAGAVELLRTQRRILAEAGDDAAIAELQVTLSSRYELTSAATSERAEGLVLYLALNRETANLAIARRRLASVSAGLVG